MANVKSKSSQRGSKRPAGRSAQAMLTTAFITKAGVALPKGAAGVTFRAPRNVVDLISAKPGNVKALLAGYGKAMAESQAAGRTVSFRVEVDPTGDTAVSPLEKPAGSADDLAAALDEARARGKVRAATILVGDDMLSADQFAALLGTTRMTVNTKRQNHQVLGLEGAKRGFRFPAWQIGEDGKPFAALPRLFERLGGGPWSVYRFLVQAHPELDGMTGREALRRGKTDEALAVADSIADGAFV
ncbi:MULTISPECIES: XRE family transcriptional regulator [unclassified Mesorhizobium]|uniref:XRE family transcriptional regulator n=1 Tax=unclassified Mesorhizobium TaxID=325217 RepID=UPI0024154C89|nr:MULTISPECIES: XRE family transcriptional regulator [unclassified Mesorhizobium]MDG4890007.1 XRE family transcriptional regulator [Mesorhizobium sp. WSM4887]MDG4904149.1 XRE family transcriptional regulator [Mesorhizobium sp. WSM4962]MDG4909176.1 XRE family transcriptional regulator [Mesorhizobium sp. WSM4898]MDG4921800.1 XRE family transcriptional regulator [Mesorhizobium sp. WSM4989]